MLEKKKKNYTPNEAKLKIEIFCNYQERCHKEVRDKLYTFGLSAQDIEEIMAYVVQKGMINEERFAKAYAGGKFRMQKWGKLKIKNELEFMGLTKNCIQRGLKEIEAGDYSKTLKALIKKKASESKEENPFKKRDKVARFAIGKGYEPDMVWECVKDLMAD